MIPESNRTEYSSHSFHFQSSGILMETIFKYKNKFHKRLELKK